MEVSNIDRLAPAADYEVMPGDWTNKPVTIRVTATDPEPEDGYAPSGVQSITKMCIRDRFNVLYQ